MGPEVRKLHECNVYLDAVGYVGLASSVTLPEVAAAVKEHAPTSMKGKVDVPLGLNKMELLIKGDFDEAFVLAASDHYHIKIIELRSTLTEFDDLGRSLERSVKATLRVLFQGYKPSEFKNGDTVELEYKAGVWAYKLDVDGVTIHDINLLGNKHTVNELNLMATNNSLLGL